MKIILTGKQFDRINTTYLVFDYLISFALSHLRTWNDLRADVTRNLQTNWLIACNSRAGHQS